MLRYDYGLCKGLLVRDVGALLGRLDFDRDLCLDVIERIVDNSLLDHLLQAGSGFLSTTTQWHCQHFQTTRNQRAIKLERAVARYMRQCQCSDSGFSSC